MKEAGLLEIKKYFDINTVKFMKEWKQFSEKEMVESGSGKTSSS